MLGLRKADSKDITTIFNWANDPVVRSNAFNQNQIAFQDHVKWFASKLQSPGVLFLILEKDNQPAGQIRYELDANEVIISYMISDKYRGLGLGTKILLMGEEYILSNKVFPLQTSIVGYVKKENIASLKAFERGGYKIVTNNHPHYRDAIKLEKLIHHEN